MSYIFALVTTNIEINGSVLSIVVARLFFRPDAMFKHASGELTVGGYLAVFVLS
jgi:hypothetical protein